MLAEEVRLLRERVEELERAIAALERDDDLDVRTAIVWCPPTTPRKYVTCRVGSWLGPELDGQPVEVHEDGGEIVAVCLDGQADEGAYRLAVTVGDRWVVV